MQTFEELSDIFSDHNNYLTSRELLMRVGVASSTNILPYISKRTLAYRPLFFSACHFLSTCLEWETDKSGLLFSVKMRSQQDGKLMP